MNEQYLYKSINNINNDYVVWMGFPGKYSFSLSSLGFLWMFKVLDECEEVNTERICSDTISTKYMVKNVNAFGFSFSFDFDFLEIFKILEKYDIPLKSSDRNTNYPLLFAGGPVVSANPEPYSQIFDFFIIGDGEDINIKAILTCKENKDRPKDFILKKLSEIDGIYVPKFKKDVTKHTKKLSECIYTPILSDESFFENTFIIEMARGCANRCGFCLASYLNLPLRSVPENDLFSAIDFGLEHTNKIAFLGAQVSAHPKFFEVCEYINKKISQGENIEMHFSSLRIDTITPEVVKTLAAAGQKNITLAIEAGSERLRKTINKNITEEQIINAVKIVAENGLKGVKIYGMLGIPSETKDDIDSIIKLAKNLKKEFKNISFGFSTFVPKPHTPFQWCGREQTVNLEKKISYLQKEMHKSGIQVNLPSAKWDYWQAVLSRGDSSLTDFLIEVYRDGGNLGAFKKLAKKMNINSDYFALNNFDTEDKLPWDFIKISPGKDFLISEYNRLL